MAETKMYLENQPQYRLTEDEISNPYQVIDDLYSFVHHRQAKEILWEWLRATVCDNFSSELEPNEKSIILTLYEKIDKLLDATHLIKERINSK